MDLQNDRELRLRDGLSASSSSEDSSSSDGFSSSHHSSNSRRSNSVRAESVGGGQVRRSPAKARDVRKEVSDVVEPSSSKPAKKKKRSAEQLVDGVCWLDAEDLDDFRRDYSVPRDVKLRLPTSGERADSPPKGYFTCVLGHFTSAFLWFPIPKVVIEFFAFYKLCLAQVTPHSLRNIVGLLVRGYEEGQDIDSSDMLCMLNAVKGRRALFHHVVPRPGFKLIGEAPRKDHDWERYFFFVRLDSRAVEGDLNLVRREWRIRARPKNVSKTLNDEGLFKLLQSRDCSWESFSFQRVSDARVAFADELVSDREPAGASSQSSESEMAEMLNLRALRAQKKREKRPIGMDDEPSASEKDRASEREVISIPVAAQGAKTPGAAKRAPEKETGAQEVGAKRRKKDHSPGKPTRVGTPIAWFTGIRHEGDLPSDYKEFEHRASVEAAWNYMAKFVMENNHVISSYEGELKARNEAISALQGQLTAAKEATDTEKSTLAQQKKKIKALQASLAERDELVTSLSERVKAAELSQAQARKEAEAACLGRVRGRFLLVSEALKELRKGPMYRLNLRGQTVNNMSLVKDLLSDKPPKLLEELAALEGEMRDYGGAVDEFEAAFGEIMEMLLEKDPGSADAENPENQPPEPAQKEVGDEDEIERSAEGAKEKDGEDPKDVNP